MIEISWVYCRFIRKCYSFKTSSNIIHRCISIIRKHSSFGCFSFFFNRLSIRFSSNLTYLSNNSQLWWSATKYNITNAYNDVDQFIEWVRTNSVNLTEEFHWIDRLSNVLKFLNIHIQNLEYLHIIRHIFVVCNCSQLYRCCSEYSKIYNCSIG